MTNNTEYDKKQALLEGGLWGEHINLRLVTTEDCNETYLSWLQDPKVIRFLETRWVEQTLESITEFVIHMMRDQYSYLFAIVDNHSKKHIGNIKIGPNNPYHHDTQLSYFIGERSAWGCGFATEAIRLVSDFSFNVLHMRWIYAGSYGRNVASQRALEKAGYVQQAVFKQKMVDGQTYDDHLWYGLRR
ncbi:MAG: GNAT family N-acetyltransferase [Gammaproteobacteria bacterium]|nr:GNAT family N-acetyltransferase [Gammaproteobacteria bacterium]